MKHFILFFPLMSILIISADGCGNGNSAPGSQSRKRDSLDMTSLKMIIDKKNDQFTKSHITGDTAFLNNIFTPDAKIFAPNTDVVAGRTAIAALNLEYIRFGIKEFREVTTALYGNEDYLINEGTYIMLYGKNNTVEKGKFINIWKSVEGDWKLHSNIWNSSLPAIPEK